MICKFKCGLCRNYAGTRKGLRLHLKDEHFIKREITNIRQKNIKQEWWLVEPFAEKLEGKGK